MSESTRSVLPEELRPKSFRLPMGLQELSRTPEWRSLQPYLKRILTSYITEDEGDWLAAVTRYRVGWEEERIAADAERIMQEPLVRAVPQIQRGEIRK